MVKAVFRMVMTLHILAGFSGDSGIVTKTLHMSLVLCRIAQNISESGRMVDKYFEAAYKFRQGKISFNWLKTLRENS